MTLRVLRSLRWPLSRWRLLALATVLHAAVVVMLRVMTYGRMSRWGRRIVGALRRRRAVPEAQIVWAVERAARLAPFGATCLSRALAVQWLLGGSRHSSTLRFGVRAGRGASFTAHAWLERDGTGIFGLAPQVYDPLDAPQSCLGLPSSR